MVMHNAYRKGKDFSHTINEAEEKLKNAASDIQDSSSSQGQQVAQMINQADRQLRENPWPVVAGVAVTCLFLGFFAGSVRSRG